MRWMTRARAHVDRTACPWLIAHFIDPGAEFLFVPATALAGEAERAGAITFDAPHARYTHRNGRCTFQVLVDEFDLGGDAALVLMGAIVRDADVIFRRRRQLESPGLEAIISGLGDTTPDDHEKLTLTEPLYDALYAYCRRKTGDPAAPE